MWPAKGQYLACVWPGIWQYLACDWLLVTLWSVSPAYLPDRLCVWYSSHKLCLDICGRWKCLQADKICCLASFFVEHIWLFQVEWFIICVCWVARTDLDTDYSCHQSYLWKAGLSFIIWLWHPPTTPWSAMCSVHSPAGQIKVNKDRLIKTNPTLLNILDKIQLQFRYRTNRV